VEPTHLAFRSNVEDQRTVRFAALVQKSGKPEVATLWTKPEEDKAFMDAMKHNRVLTVAQRLKGNKKGFLDIFSGTVGWEWGTWRDDARRDISSVVGIGGELESDSDRV
jgi:hypothetical protein